MRLKAFLAVAVVLFGCRCAAAQYALAPPAQPAPVGPSECQLRLAKLATFRNLPPLVGPGECGAPDVVLLQRVTLSDRTAVTFSPPATLRCAMAEAIANWVRDDVAPAAIRHGSPLRSLEIADSYECRDRNRIPGAKLSEHGRANALDIHGFRLASGRAVALTDVNVAKDWREAIRASACARFATVLGPGSDGYHEEHIHLDLEPRHHGYKICEWDVRTPGPLVQAAPPSGKPISLTPQAALIPAEAVPLPRPRPSPGPRWSGYGATRKSRTY